MKPFDLKQFEKVSEDKKTVTMKHPSGHVITIALTAIPKIQREQLKQLKMSKGGVAKYAEGTPESPVSEADVAPAAGMARAPINVPQVQVQPSTPLLNQDSTLNASGAVNLQQQAGREQQAVDMAKGKGQAEIEDSYLKQKAAIAQRDQDAYKELKQHTDETMGAVKAGLINPNHYVENMSVGNKVANAFGLLFGGFKQGLSGGPNPAMDYLNNQISRDIDAQKARSEQQKTILGAYQSLYGDSNIANNLAKVSMNDIYTHKGQQLAAQLGTPQAKATADAFASQKAIENNQLLVDTAGRLGTLRTGSGAGAQPATLTEPSGSQKKGIQNIDYKILKPGAEQDIAGKIKYDPSIPDGDKAKMMSQMTQASQAEKGLGDVRKKFTDLANESLHGQVNGRVHRTLNPHVLSGIGAGVGAGIGAAAGGPKGSVAGAGIGSVAGEGLGQGVKMLTNNDLNRRYDADKTALLGYISAALKGTNIGAGQIQEIVDANSPEYGDEPESLRKKLANIRDFIINHTETDALKRHGMSYR